LLLIRPGSNQFYHSGGNVETGGRIRDIFDAVGSDRAGGYLPVTGLV
jgi:hypothetical protein